MFKIIAFLLLFALKANAYTVISEGLVAPWSINYAEGDLYVSEKRGMVFKINPETGIADTLLRLFVNDSGQGGLMDLAIDLPYVYLVCSDFFGYLVFEKYELIDGKLSNPCEFMPPIETGNLHLGCRLLLDKPNNQIFISIGDQHEASNAQDLTNFYGKIVVVNLDFNMPQIYSYGHRNVQGLCFDNEGNMWASEHGTDFDEINIIVEGGNYGWGTTDPYIEPERLINSHFAPSGICWNDGLIIASLKKEGVYSYSNILKRMTEGFGRIRDVTENEGVIYFCTSNRDQYGIPSEFDDRIVKFVPDSEICFRLQGHPEVTDIQLIVDNSDTILFNDYSGAQIFLSLEGIHSVRVVHHNHLDKYALTNFPTKLDFGELMAGDLNGDGVITVHDFNSFSLESISDIDGNGVVTVGDYNIMYPNMGLIGQLEIR